MMKPIVVTAILLSYLILVSCSGRATGEGADAQEGPDFSVEVKNRDDQVSFHNENNSTIIAIESPMGVGSAAFTLVSGKMPEHIIVRLHLKGLEEFRLVSRQVTVVASVPSSGGLNAQSETKISGNSELPILPFDPLWLKVEIVSTSESIPLQAGYFEILVPPEFLTQSEDRFDIRWIDFFR